MKNKKVVAMVAAMSVVGALTIGGTMAWLTSKSEVVNTFTINTVGGDIDEDDSDDSTPDKDRDKRNEYDMVPGKSEMKDPTVHMNNTETTVPSYVFIKVEEVIEEGLVFDDYIDYGIDTTSWKKVDGSEGVQEGLYYQEYDPASSNKDIPVLKQVDLDGDKKLDAQGITYKDTINNNMMKALEEKGKTLPQLKFKMGVIQKEGFADVKAAAVELGLTSAE